MIPTERSSSERHADTVLATSAAAIPDVDEFVEHLNADHADTIRFLVRHIAACHEPVHAEVTEIGQFGVDVDVDTHLAPTRVHLPFPTPVSDLTGAHQQLRALLVTARERAGDAEPLTSVERETSSTRDLPTLVTHVAAVTDRSPNLREVVLHGGLEEFVSRGGDQFVYLMVRRDPRGNVPADHTITAQLAGDPDSRPIAAYYTVRSWDAQTQRLTLWLARHGHHTSVGEWAGRCEIGERVALWGPRRGRTIRTDATSYLFVTDETGLGAVAALLDELPPETPALVLAETADHEHVVELPPGPNTTVTWHFREGDAPGTSTRLLCAVQELDLRETRPHDLVAFGAGEARQIAALRRHLRRDVGMPPANVVLTGYWRRS